MQAILQARSRSALVIILYRSIWRYYSRRSQVELFERSICASWILLVLKQKQTMENKMTIGKEIKEAPVADPVRPRWNSEQQTKELILITWKSGAMIAVDREQALDEILASFDDIEDIAVVDYRPAS